MTPCAGFPSESPSSAFPPRSSQNELRRLDSSFSEAHRKACPRVSAPYQATPGKGLRGAHSGTSKSWRHAFNVSRFGNRGKRDAAELPVERGLPVALSQNILSREFSRRSTSGVPETNPRLRDARRSASDWMVSTNLSKLLPPWKAV